MPTLSQVVTPLRLRFRKHNQDVIRIPQRSMDEFLAEVEGLFTAPLDPHRLLSMSSQLQDEFRESLQSSSHCMLPSFNHTLPTGEEHGTYLALDVGGTNFRVALVELNGNGSASSAMGMSKMRSFKIDKSVRTLAGSAFFAWMAERIQEVLSTSEFSGDKQSATLPMGLAWSFPISQTSEKTGTILPMGKGFLASEGLIGQDLSEQLMVACRQRNLNVRMDAIINDASATLLTRAFADNATNVALILGTGFNAAAHLPVTLLSQEKFGSRPPEWHEKAQHVLVNTELSMFGKDVFPLTRWDQHIKAHHHQPDYQPFEHLISGMYLGEITRLILIEAIETAGLFGGILPQNFTDPHSFDTGLMAVFESDPTPHLTTARTTLLQSHPLPTPPSLTDLLTIRRIAHLVSHRAAAFLATGTHALWSLRTKAEGLAPSQCGHIAIGCNGSVIEKYPAFKSRCQSILDRLTSLEGAPPGSVLLEEAVESALFGAAVAASFE